MKSNISIIITSYNRQKLVLGAIKSVLLNSCKSYIIVVDDCSSDNTIKLIKRTFTDQINNNILQVVKTPFNLGVTGAKNFGFLLAKTQFVGFLDSDDKLFHNAINLMNDEVVKNKNHSIYFFRCKDEKGNFIGKKFKDSKIIDLKYFLKYTTHGEAFTLINKKIVKKTPYYSILRGYEGLGCAKILEKSTAILSKYVVREYKTDGSQRLSVGKSFFNRLHLLATGNLIIIRKYGNILSIKQKYLMLSKALIYKFLSYANRYI